MEGSAGLRRFHALMLPFAALAQGRDGALED
jgi:hypothetical protein